MIRKGDKFIVLRYGTGMYDCIARHTEVINQFGYCWFGKIGIAPSEKVIHSKLNKERMYAILYCQGKAHLCEVIEVSTQKPEEGYPTYYDSFLFGRNINPKLYFKFGSIEPMKGSDLAKCVIMSSGKPLVETLSRSMASFFYAEYPEKRRVIEHTANNSKENSKKKGKEKNGVVDKHSCIYRKDGTCTNRKCISFQYECTRPSACIKQKPALVGE